MYKKIATLFFPLIVFLSFIHAQNKATIRGVLNFDEPVQKLSIMYGTENGMVTDSFDLKNNRFKLEVKLTEPVLSYIVAGFKPSEGQIRRRYEKIPVFLEPGEIKITCSDSLKFARITGSKCHDAFVVFNRLQEPYDLRSLELSRTRIRFREEKNEEGMKRIDKDLEKLEQKKKEEVYLPYLQKNTASPIALYVLKLYAGYDIDVKTIEPIFESLAAGTKQSSPGIAFKEKIETARKTGIGMYAMNFTQNDTLGNPVSLASFKGKYVLIDFWASWCGPCRADNPNLVKAYNNYKGNGFTVLGVSLDKPGKKQAWLDAIHKDGLTWAHLSDLKFWDNEVAQQYAIRAIPQNLLIDPTGKIIAKNLHGEGLNKKLEELIK